MNLGTRSTVGLNSGSNTLAGVVTIPGGTPNGLFTLAQAQASLQNQTYTFNPAGNSYAVTPGALVH